MYVYTYTRNYALAIASASFDPGSRRDPLEIPLASKVWSPKMPVLDPIIFVLNRFQQLFNDF